MNTVICLRRLFTPRGRPRCLFSAAARTLMTKMPYLFGGALRLLGVGVRERSAPPPAIASHKYQRE